MLNYQSQAVLLLTAYFSKSNKEGPRPLSPSEWGRFALWLKEHNLTPEDLLLKDAATLISMWSDRTVTIDRIQCLLNRSSALALALEKWQRAGLWIMTRSDSDYPIRLKVHLKNDSPPILFGCGDRQLLNAGGIAVVGSRNANAEELDFAKNMGISAALQGLNVVSGGARGIDESAMLGALDQEGAVIGVLADGLLRAATSAKYRHGLMHNNLVLISPFNPEAGFDVGNAMARNKYIYCLSDAAVVVSSTQGKGGTWNGAIEALRNAWVPLWVLYSNDIHSGNSEMVSKGARWLSSQKEGLDLASLMATRKKGEGDEDNNIGSSETNAANYVPSNAEPLQNKEDEALEIAKPATMSHDTLEGFNRETSFTAELLEPIHSTSKGKQNSLHEDSGDYFSRLSFYDIFLVRVRRLTEKDAKTIDEIMAEIDVGKSQLTEWLKRATDEFHLNRLNKPTRYQWNSLKSQ